MAARSSDWPGRIRDSAGVVLASNPRTGIWTDETRWIAERDLAIGAGRPAAPEYEFGLIADVDVGADGRIYVLDNQAGKVAVFEPDGQYAFAFGRLGRGPGAFSIEAFAIRIDPDGTVAVRDGINQRDNLFTAEGNFLRVVPLGGSFKESAGLPQGNRVERATTPSLDGLLRVAPDGSIIDTIKVFEYDMTRRGGVLSSGGRGADGNTVGIPLLPPAPAWGVTSDGHVITGISNRYRLEVRRPDGVLEMVVYKDHDSLELSSEAREGMLERVRELLRSAGLSDAAIAGVFERFSYIPPDSLPAFSNIVGGPAGTIWVQAVLPVESMTANATIDALNPGAATWDLFCGDGRYLGQIVLPAAFRLMKVEGPFIYGIEADELDVQRPVRLILRPARSASDGRLSC